MLAVLFSGGCGGDSEDASTSAEPTTEAGTDDGGGTEDGAQDGAEPTVSVVEVPDPCKLLSAEEISTIAGVPVTGGPTSDPLHATGPLRCRWDLEAQPGVDGQPSRKPYVQVMVYGGKAADVSRKSAERTLEMANERQQAGATCGTIEPIADVEDGFELVSAPTGGALCATGTPTWIERDGFTMTASLVDPTVLTDVGAAERRAAELRAKVHRLLAAVAKNVDGAATVEVPEVAPDPDAPDPCKILTSDQVSAVVGQPVTSGPTDVTLDDFTGPECRWDFESPAPAPGATVQQVYAKLSVESGNTADRPRAAAESTIEAQAEQKTGSQCSGTLEIQPVAGVDGAFGLVSVGDACVSSNQVWLELDGVTITAVYVGAYDRQTDLADFRAISEKLITAVADAV